MHNMNKNTSVCILREYDVVLILYESTVCSTEMCYSLYILYVYIICIYYTSSRIYLILVLFTEQQDAEVLS